MPEKGATAVVFQEFFPVLSLPREIRDRIWYFAVVINHLVIVHNRERTEDLLLGRSIADQRTEGSSRTYSLLSVAFTCRQIYLEVTPIYYSKNLFFFCLHIAVNAGWRTNSEIFDFKGAIGKQNARKITSVAADLVSAFFPLNGRTLLSSYLPSKLRYLDLLYPYPSVGPYKLDEHRLQLLEHYTQQHPNVIIKINGEPWRSQIHSLGHILPNPRQLPGQHCRPLFVYVPRNLPLEPEYCP